MTYQVYAALAKGALLTPWSYEPQALGFYDIEVKITHCGVCHSDIHLIHNDWGISQYPLVPGHEIVGHVVKKGDGVVGLEVGERVGIGWQRSACLRCEWCLKGEEALCPDNQAICVGHHGGYADYIRTDSRFAFPLPENLSSEEVAPLLCGGVTSFTPFLDHAIKPTMKVGVIGIGGLGHMALKFAVAWGCEVTAISSSPNKEKEVKSLGVHHFISNSDPSAMQQAANSLDFIISTANADLDWMSVLQLLRPQGKLCFVGSPPSPINIPAFLLIGSKKTICGSLIGNRTAIRTMLDFCGRNKIGAQVEKFPMSEVNEVLTRVKENKVRYRAVLSIGE